MYRGCKSDWVGWVFETFDRANIFGCFKYFDFSLSACTGGDCSSGTSGTVKSGNYPSNYDNDKHVTFPLEVASGSSIELEFTGGKKLSLEVNESYSFSDIDIEPHGSCSYDYVQVLIRGNLCIILIR